MKSLTTMPRFTSRPAMRPNSTFGRMPAAITTMLAGTVSPSANCTPSTCALPSSAAVFLPHRTRTPRFSILRASIAPPEGSSCRSINVSIKWTTVTWQPCTCNPRAASSPNKPPPITTALTPGPESSSSARVSSTVRNTNTPFFFVPSMGGMNGELPVAIRSLSNGVTTPASSVTVLAAVSTATTRLPARSWMSLSRYHSTGFSVMSSSVFSPASTDDNRMRL